MAIADIKQKTMLNLSGKHRQLGVRKYRLGRFLGKKEIGCLVPIESNTTKDDQESDNAKAESETQDKLHSTFKARASYFFCSPVEEMGKAIVDLQKRIGQNGACLLTGAPNLRNAVIFYGFSANRTFCFNAYQMFFTKLASEAFG